MRDNVKINKCRSNDIIGTIYNPENGKLEFNLETLIKVTGGELTAEHKNSRELIDNFTYKKVLITGKHPVFFNLFSELKNTDAKALYDNNTIIVSAEEFMHDGKQIPLIKVKNVRIAYENLARYYKNVFEMPTVAITGAVGKTTITEMLKTVLDQKHKVFVSGGNLNAPLAIINQITSRMDDSYDLHIQETGGGSQHLVRASARILNVDAWVVSKIDTTHHIDKYLTTENLIKDKLSYDEVSKPDSIGIINGDDPILSKHEFKHKTISYGVENKDVDCRAENIRQINGKLTFDIIYQNERTSITANIIGKHNAYNIMAVFIVAKMLGLDNETIKKGIFNYETTGIRQVVKKIAGRYFYIDCFNVCGESILSCLHSLDEFIIDENNKKIAVIGGENALGAEHYKKNFATGTKLLSNSVDEYYFVSEKETMTEEEINNYGNSKAIYEGAATIIRKDKLKQLVGIDGIVDMLTNHTKPGDVILLKGIFRIGLATAIDIAFGTSFTFLDNKTFVPYKLLSNDRFIARKYNRLEQLRITRIKAVTESINFPNCINNERVFSLGNNLCKDFNKLTEISCEAGIRNIGIGAFKNCSNLKIVNIENVEFLEESSFENCTALTSISLKRMLHISKCAFKNCSNLKQVYLGEACSTIEEDAFCDCPNINFVVHRDSYAELWVKRNNFNYICI